MRRAGCGGRGAEGGALTPEGGVAVEVLGRVLEQAVAPVVVLDAVERDRLEAAPAERHDERVARLQDPTVPPVTLQTHLGGRTDVRTVGFAGGWTGGWTGGRTGRQTGGSGVSATVFT